MKKLLLSLPIILVLGVFTMGFTTKDEKAEQLIQASKAKFESLKDISANFKFAINNPRISTQPKPKEGWMRYKKGKGQFVFAFADQEIYCDGATQWIFLPEEGEFGEVTITHYDPELGENAEAIFKIYEGSAQPELKGEENIHGVNCYKIFLNINNDEADYNQAYVWINKSSKMLEKVDLKKKKKTTTTYELLNIKVDQGLGDKDFQFDKSKHPGVEVFDER
ncbi:MAG: outer membrane lipoprotein carrier protein LolA [Bacteroidetes bacterium]|nr:outer membrane lipoprotein carrier protein LolA [Bacteroidota bacterium]